MRHSEDGESIVTLGAVEEVDPTVQIERGGIEGRKRLPGVLRPGFDDRVRFVAEKLVRGVRGCFLLGCRFRLCFRFDQRLLFRDERFPILRDGNASISSPFSM